MSEDKHSELGIAFMETSEFQELSDALDQFEEDKTGAMVSVEVRIPKRYLTLLQFLEAKTAEHETRAPLPPDQMLTSVLVGYLEHHHPTLGVGRTSPPYYLAAWNRFCDEQGAPDQKISPLASALELPDEPF